MNTKELDRKIIMDIIADKQRIAVKQKKEDWIKCLDIEKAAMEEPFSISKPTFYRRLEEMTKEGILLKNAISKKDVRYRVNFDKLEGTAVEATLFKYHVLSDVNEQIDRHGKSFDEVEVVRETRDWLGALCVFTLIKQIETGQPWTDAVDYCLTYSPGLNAIIRKKIVPPTWDMEELSKAANLITNEPLGKYEEYKPAIEKFIEAFERVCNGPGSPVESFEFILDQIRQGKSPYLQRAALEKKEK